MITLLLLACTDDTTTPTEHPGTVYADEGLDIVRNPFEDPTWEVAGFSTFVAPIGTEADGYEATKTTLACIFPNHQVDWENAPTWLAPANAHPGPYEKEVFTGVEGCGYVGDEGAFQVSQFSVGQGLVLLFTLVPGEGAPVGRTTDGEEVPMIGTADLRINAETELIQNGQSFHDGLDLTGPLLQDLGMGGVDGLSHWPMFLTYPFEEIPDHVDLTGDWSWAFTLTDAFGAGWTGEVKFTFADE